MSSPTENPYESSAYAPTYESSAHAPSERRHDGPPAHAENLTGGDWILIVLFSVIAFFVGLIRLIQGKPNGAPMLGYSILFMFLWAFVRTLIVAGAQ
jgi:hypothetical protein